jgi:hypothetical protein
VELTYLGSLVNDIESEWSCHFDASMLMGCSMLCELPLVLSPTGNFMPSYPTLLWCGVDLVGRCTIVITKRKL